MDHIRKAIDRVQRSPENLHVESLSSADTLSPRPRPHIDAEGVAKSGDKAVMLDTLHLESKRIISHDVADPRSKSFDMLRTQVLQSMDARSWKFLGVTSPTASCGKSTISTNLAISIARQSDRSVLLVDMDFQKPQVATLLGLKPKQGILSVLEGRSNLSSTVIRANIKSQQFSVLPCERSTLHSSEWMASSGMRALLEEIKRDCAGWAVIFDLPPILTGDDVITILPQMDCLLFVAAVGVSTQADIKEASKHLRASSVVRVVVNKAADTGTTYYAYSKSRYSDNQELQ